MDNQLQVFNHEKFGEVRTIIKNNEAWFIGKDVAEALGYKRPTKAVQDHIDIEDIDEVPIQDSIGRNQNTPIINESGMYSLILRSDLSSAKEFKRWVTSEVLPSIRKHGAYMTEQTLEKALTSPDFLIQLATNLKEEQERNRQLQEANDIMKPKALFADAVETSGNSILVGQLAKLIKQNGIDIGQNRLFEWLRNNGYLIKRKGEDFNTPTQRSMDLKLMEIKKRTITNPDGSVRVTKTTKITGKGQIYFINRFLEED